MSETLRRVQALVVSGEVEVSRHGLQELAADGILLEDAVSGAADAEEVEDYPDFHEGSSVLALQRDSSRPASSCPLGHGSGLRPRRCW